MTEQDCKTTGKEIIHEVLLSSYNENSCNEILITDEVDRRKTALRAEIKKCSEDKNHFLGSQGQIKAKFKIENNLQPVGYGSGMLFTKINPDESKSQIILTCAHNFENKKKNYEEPESAEFYFRMSRNENKTKEWDVDTEITWKIFPQFKNNRENFYNDFAIAFCKDDLSKHLKRKNIHILDLQEADVKKGDTICVAGYPHDEEKKDKNYLRYMEKEENFYLKYMEKEITDICYNDGSENEEAIIKYDDIDTSEGQSGSPVYLKRNDTWVIIGVHIRWDEGKRIDGTPYRYNIAVGITKSKKDWILKLIEDHEATKQ